MTEVVWPRTDEQAELEHRTLAAITGHLKKRGQRPHVYECPLPHGREGKDFYFDAESGQIGGCQGKHKGKLTRWKDLAEHLGIDVGQIARELAKDRDEGWAITATYDYRDVHGALLFQVLRKENGTQKKFVQRRPNGHGGWVWNLQGVKRVLYRLSELLTADPGLPVFVVEGEKDADRLSGLDIVATCSPHGAGKWTAHQEHYSNAFRDRRVVIIPDNDEPGRMHVKQVINGLANVASSVQVLELPGLPEKGDTSTWLDNGGDPGELIALANEAPTAAEWLTDVQSSTWDDLDRILGPIRWAWRGWLPLGFLVILAAEEGKGKSSLLLRIASTFLRGDPWPDGDEYAGAAGKVVWCEAEASQAVNLERAKVWGLPTSDILHPLANPLEGIRLDNEEHRTAIKAIALRSDVRLVVVDSLRGAHGRDENSSETAAITIWLAELARDTTKPVILTHHLRKRGILDLADKVSLDRLRGSSAITQTARVVWAIDSPDPNSPEDRRLSVIKNNLARFPEPIGFRIDDTGLVFGDAPEPPRQETQLDRATDLLQALLGDGPMPSTDLETEAQGAGISWSTMNRAKDRLGIVARRKDDRWYWALPVKEQGAYI
jgi:hypothetical protein